MVLTVAVAVAVAVSFAMAMVVIMATSVLCVVSVHRWRSNWAMSVLALYFNMGSSDRTLSVSNDRRPKFHLATSLQ